MGFLTYEIAWKKKNKKKEVPHLDRNCCSRKRKKRRPIRDEDGAYTGAWGLPRLDNKNLVKSLVLRGFHYDLRSGNFFVLIWTQTRITFPRTNSSRHDGDVWNVTRKQVLPNFLLVAPERSEVTVKKCVAEGRGKFGEMSQGCPCRFTGRWDVSCWQTRRSLITSCLPQHTDGIRGCIQIQALVGVREPLKQRLDSCGFFSSFA